MWVRTRQTSIARQPLPVVPESEPLTWKAFKAVEMHQCGRLQIIHSVGGRCYMASALQMFANSRFLHEFGRGTLRESQDFQQIMKKLHANPLQTTFGWTSVERRVNDINTVVDSLFGDRTLFRTQRSGLAPDYMLALLDPKYSAMYSFSGFCLRIHFEHIELRHSTNYADLSIYRPDVFIDGNRSLSSHPPVLHDNYTLVGWMVHVTMPEGMHAASVFYCYGTNHARVVCDTNFDRPVPLHMYPYRIRTSYAVYVRTSNANAPGTTSVFKQLILPSMNTSGR